MQKRFAPAHGKNAGQNDADESAEQSGQRRPDIERKKGDERAEDQRLQHHGFCRPVGRVFIHIIGKVKCADGPGVTGSACRNQRGKRKARPADLTEACNQAHLGNEDQHQRDHAGGRRFSAHKPGAFGLAGKPVDGFDECAL